MGTPHRRSSGGADSLLEIKGHVFDLDTHQGARATGGPITLKKPRWMVDRYLELAEHHSGGNMVELGLWDGGSTAFLALVFNPRSLIGFELDEQPLDALDAFVAGSVWQDRIHIHLGVDQSDGPRLRREIADQSDDGLLDVVIDDASHLLDPSAATFDCLFPLLRPGGLYVIEDWSHEHQLAFKIRLALQSGQLDEADLRLDEGAAVPATPLSRLVIDAMLGTANDDGVIEDVRVRQGFAEIRRGEAEVAPDFALRDHIGEIGRAVSPRPD